MKHIKKIWVRLLLSVLAGGVMAEIVHMKTGNSSPEASNMIVYLGAIIMFSFLSFIVWVEKYRYYFFPEKTNTESDILDDFD